MEGLGGESRDEGARVGRGRWDGNFQVCELGLELRYPCDKTHRHSRILSTHTVSVIIDNTNTHCRAGGIFLTRPETRNCASYEVFTKQRSLGVILHFGFHTQPFHGPNYVLSTVCALILHITLQLFMFLRHFLPICTVISSPLIHSYSKLYCGA